jgi:hypothetical protein
MGNMAVLLPYQTAGACINVVLALAYMMRDDPLDCTHRNFEATWNIIGKCTASSE